MATELLVDHYAKAFLRGVAGQGISASMLQARRLGLGERYCVSDLLAISRNAKMLSGDEFCGLTENRVRLGSFELMCEMAVLSATLEDALDRAFRFYRAVTRDVEFGLDKDGARAAIVMSIASDRWDPDHVLAEWWLLFWHRFAQWLTNEEVVIDLVEFPHRSEVDASAYWEMLSPNVRFGAPAARLSFPVSALGRRVVRDIDELETFKKPHQVDFANQGGPGFAEALRARLQTYLERDQMMPKLEVLALEFGMCGQTLRRRLEAKGISYRQLKAEVRRKVALRCLNDDQMPIREVSLRAGFAEPNGLSRAIRSWAGVSPTHYRAMLSAGEMPTLRAR